jgi:hypothetical protein
MYVCAYIWTYVRICMRAGKLSLLELLNPAELLLDCQRLDVCGLEDGGPIAGFGREAAEVVHPDEEGGLVSGREADCSILWAVGCIAAGARGTVSS